MNAEYGQDFHELSDKTLARDGADWQTTYYFDSTMANLDEYPKSDSDSLMFGSGGPGFLDIGQESNVAPQSHYSVPRNIEVVAPTTAPAHLPRRRSPCQVDELLDVTYVVDPTGQLIYCSSAIFGLFGYTKEEIARQGIAAMLHPEDVTIYANAFNECITTMENFIHYHRMRKKDGDFILVETIGRPLYDEQKLSIDARGNTVPMCRCLIMSARPYPSRSVMAMDNFFELKVENEQLKAELREVGLTEIDFDGRSGDVKASHPTRKRDTAPVDTVTGSTLRRLMADKTIRRASDERTGGYFAASEIRLVSGDIDFSASQPPQMTPPFGFAGSSNSPTLSGFPADALLPTDDMHQPPLSVDPHAVSFNDPTSADASGSATTTTTKTSLTINGTLTTGPSSSSRKKVKKVKSDIDEFVCTDCGTTDSPEWRKGPMGAKTLCNACGLRFAKKQRRVDHTTPHHHPLHGHGHGHGHSNSVGGHGSGSGQDADADEMFGLTHRNSSGESSTLTNSSTDAAPLLAPPSLLHKDSLASDSGDASALTSGAAPLLDMDMGRGGLGASIARTSSDASVSTSCSTSASTSTSASSTLSPQYRFNTQGQRPRVRGNPHHQSY